MGCCDLLGCNALTGVLDEAEMVLRDAETVTRKYLVDWLTCALSFGR
jgi:hypothetical protein